MTNAETLEIFAGSLETNTETLEILAGSLVTYTKKEIYI